MQIIFIIHNKDIETYYNILKKIAKNINVDYTEKYINIPV